MTPSKRNPRRVAAEIVARWEKGGEKVDVLRDRLLGSDEEWDERDRGLVTEIAYGVVRRKDDLDAELGKLVKAGLSKMQRRLLAILRVGLYQIRYLDRVPTHAAVNEAVEHATATFGKKAGGLVNAVLRRAVVEEGRRPVDGFYAEGTQLNLWRRKWVEQWGEEKTDELIHYFERRPTVALRRNLLRTESDEQWFRLLQTENAEAVPVEGWPGYAYVKGVKPDDLPSFRIGKTTVQDPAAGIAVHVLDPQPGEAVLDLCCAPGGKTAHIWERMHGEGELLAVDKHMKRNQLTREGLARLGHTGVKVQTQDVMMFSEGRYDRVLIDVPCSGTGVSHRRADLLVRRHPLQVEKLAQLQRGLLAHAAELVKPGGVLVYSTCSLEPEENEKQVQGFDRKFGKEFQRDTLPDGLREAWVRGPGEAATWPPRDRIDGAFVVRWRRVQ